jgi:hypothetical protein
MQFLPFVLEATPGPNNERQKRALSDDDCGGRAELMLRFLPPNKVCWQTNFPQPRARLLRLRVRAGPRSLDQVVESVAGKINTQSL